MLPDRHAVLAIPVPRAGAGVVLLLPQRKSVRRWADLGLHPQQGARLVVEDEGACRGCSDILYQQDCKIPSISPLMIDDR